MSNLVTRIGFGWLFLKNAHNSRYTWKNGHNKGEFNDPCILPHGCRYDFQKQNKNQMSEEVRWYICIMLTFFTVRFFCQFVSISYSLLHIQGNSPPQTFSCVLNIRYDRLLPWLKKSLDEVTLLLCIHVCYFPRVLFPVILIPIHFIYAQMLLQITMGLPKKYPNDELGE
jgi:hypothetical protein